MSESGAQRPADPDWLRDAWRATTGELKLFLVTAVAFLRAPKRFGAEWSEGRLRALNPLAFALNAVGVTF